MAHEQGEVAWVDLTVENAEAVRDFYAAVVGWVPSPVSMGDYDDFNMNAPVSGEPVAGVCHARGAQADLPAQWLIYLIVEDVDVSAARCEALGGMVLVAPRATGKDRYCVIQDVAGAVVALYTVGARP